MEPGIELLVLEDKDHSFEEGASQQPEACLWLSEPEQWASALRQQLNVQLLLATEKRPDLSSEGPLFLAPESLHSKSSQNKLAPPWASQRRQRQFLRTVSQLEQPTALDLLVQELQTLILAVLQDRRPEAWHYLHAVLGLLPPYRTLLTNRLDVLPFLEQLYLWAPWVQAQFQLDILKAMYQAFPPDTTLLDCASHVDCSLRRRKRVFPGLQCPACPFVYARSGGEQEKELATWLQPLTLPELQHYLGIVGPQVAVEESWWLNGLGLLPLALATDIPVQYEKDDTDPAAQKSTENRDTEFLFDSETWRKKKKRRVGFVPQLSLLGNQMLAVLRTERYLKKIHFLYLNVAPSRYFRPYNLVVVSPKKVNPEHYIFSPFGVLHVHPVEGNETMTLGTWHRHSVLWQQLQFIPFFKHCLLRKAFTCWRRRVKLLTMDRCRIFLEKNLLTTVPHFGVGLLHINRLLQEMYSVSWLPKDPQGSYELLDLKQALVNETHKALHFLHRCLYLCTSILQLIHKDTYKMHQGLQERVRNSKRIRKGQGSVYLQRVQNQQLEHKLKQAETWLLHLGQLARLVDYMICQSLVSTIQKEITSFVANILQAPRQNPFLSTRLVFDSSDQLSHDPRIENITRILNGGLGFLKSSVLKMLQSVNLSTPWNFEEEDEEGNTNTEFLMLKFQSQLRDTVSIFCGPDVGLVFPWKTHTSADVLEVRGHRLRGQYLPTNYNQLKDDLNNNPQIKQALNIQQSLLQDMLCEVQEFCREHHWMIRIYKFLKNWGPRKLASMKGCPIKNYVTLVDHLKFWHIRISKMPSQKITKGKLLLLNCHDIKAELESKIKSIWKDILQQVQNECKTRSKQLMRELTRYMETFQNISDDIYNIARCSQKLNEASEHYSELEERMEYIRSLHELIRNHFNFYNAETEALDILLLDMWEAFQFEKSQTSELLLSHRHAIVPKLQQRMAAALAELECIIQKALSDPFMDPLQDLRGTEQQLITMELQYQNTASHLTELHQAYVAITGDESPLSMPACGTRPIVQQQQIWHLYRIVCENISDWKCMAFAKFSLAAAKDKIEGWLTEAAQMSTNQGLHSPVLQCCMRLLEKFNSYLPLLTKLASLSPRSLNYQAFLRALDLGGISNLELLTLGQLLSRPLLEFSDRINQIWLAENQRKVTKETLQQLQYSWDAHQLRIQNFILHVPYEPPVSERNRKQMAQNTQWEPVDVDSGTFILSDYSSLQDSIQECLPILFKILTTHKSGDLHIAALEWLANLKGLGTLLEVWVIFQQKWIFLNKVLHEMKISLPSSDLNSRFQALDHQYRTLMQISIADPQVMSLIKPTAHRDPAFQGQRLQQMLQKGSVELEGIIVALESVLYGLCAQFPRLFFLSDSELVALLSSPLELPEVQQWVQRCFPHVRVVSFRPVLSKEKSQMLESSLQVNLNTQTQEEAFAVGGAGGEVMQLQEPLLLHRDIPTWLASLEKGLRLTLVHMLQDCVASRLALSPSLREVFQQVSQNQVHPQQYVHHCLDLMQTFPWQCVQVAEDVLWWAEMEEDLLKGRTQDMVPWNVQKLELLIYFLRTQRASQGRQSNLSNRQISLLSALLVTAVSHRDIAQLLQQHHVSNVKDFHWARQLKYRLGYPQTTPPSPLQSLKTVASTKASLSPPVCWIEVLGRAFLYNYEYLGPRLESLPRLLPEQPALVLLLALEEAACGTLLGPSGIGKTSIVKNLAQALGRLLVVIPCLPQMEAQSLSKYLNGALQSGAWLLLKAAQRLPLGLLSALGQRLSQLCHLYTPLSQKISQNPSIIDPTCSQVLGRGIFEKHDVSIRLGYGCFMTLCTHSTTVPANLHHLLRPMSLKLPDLHWVIEMTLLGAGIRDASRMATRLSKFFSMECELISGPLPCRLPLLRRVLENMMQSLSRTMEDPAPQHFQSIAAIEEAALLHALVDSPLFNAVDGARLHKLRELLCGLFPGASNVLAKPLTCKLKKPVLVEKLRQIGLYPSPEILGSLEQLSQALDQTAGILLLGPAGSGKTTCWHSLFKIQNQLAMESSSSKECQSVEITHLYPSALSSQEFLGWLEGSYWHRGIFPKLFHETLFIKQKAWKSIGIQHWIICDGVASAAWLDSVTCLLSDPFQLSLPSGQQIARSQDTFLLLELGDTTGMAPTVVGRCTLVWCGGKQTYQSMLSALMASLTQDYHLQQHTVTELNHLAEVLVPATFRFLTLHGASSLLQVHGQQALCSGVAEVTSLARIFRCLLNSIDKKAQNTGVPILIVWTFAENFGRYDTLTQIFKGSKNNVLNQAQLGTSDTSNKNREHLLAVNSFIFALVWGFGAHLPSRFWLSFDTFLREAISCLPNYPELPPSILMFDLYVCPQTGKLVPFTGQYLSSHIKGSLGNFKPSSEAERLLYMVDLLLSEGYPVLLAGEAAAGKSAFVEVLVEPHHPFTSSPIHPAFTTTHFRLLLSQVAQGQTQTNPRRYLNSKGSFLFLLEDLHLAASDPERSCQPVLETLRQAMDGTMYAHDTLELQTLPPSVNFLATATVPGFCERSVCPRLFRLFTVLALSSVTVSVLQRRHGPTLHAWLERFPSVEREGSLARAMVQASLEAWEAVSGCFMPSPLHPHYRFSLHSVGQILDSIQALPIRTGIRGFMDYSSHQDHLKLVLGLHGTRLTVMMTTCSMVRLWLHEAQRTFCDRLDSHRERSYCAKLLLAVAQKVFCCAPISQDLGKGFDEGEEEEGEEDKERVPEVESEGELAQWEDLSSSGSEKEEEEKEGAYGLQVSMALPPSVPPSIGPVKKGDTENLSQKVSQEEGKRPSTNKLKMKRSKIWWQKARQTDLTSPLLLPVLLLRPQENPSDLVFCRELIMGSSQESVKLYLERQWERLREQLASTAAKLKLNPSLAQCHTMVQHVARLVRVLARPGQHGLLLAGALGTGRRTAVTLAAGICQARLFHLPAGSKEATLQCLQDASWHAGVFGRPVALLVSRGVDLHTLHCLLALANSGSFPAQYSEADLDRIEEHMFRENIKQNIRKEMLLQRFYQQVCSHLHMFFLIEDEQAQKHLPCTLFLRLLKLAIASIDHYEPWDQASLVSVAQHYLKAVQSPPGDSDPVKFPDFEASVMRMARVMALIHLSAGTYQGVLCPELPLVTPKTFLDFLDTFMLVQKEMSQQMRKKAQQIQDALENLEILLKQHHTYTNLICDLEQQLKDFRKDAVLLRQMLDQNKLQHSQQLSVCQQQENLIENLTKQRDALRAQYEAFLEQMSTAFLRPLNQLQMTDFEEIRSYRAPPESVVRVTDAMCNLFHHETGWPSAKQLLCSEDFYQELVYFPKDKITDSELTELSRALQGPGMSEEALREASLPVANLAAWLWAIVHYKLAQHRGQPTGQLLEQVEATLAQEQARLGHYQLQAQKLLEKTNTLLRNIEETQKSYSHILEDLQWAQCGQYHKWPVKAALLTPKVSWTSELQKVKKHCQTIFGDALLCSAAIIYLGPFPPLRRQEILDKWLALCQGYQETLGPDDVAQAIKPKQDVSMPPKVLLSTRCPFNLLSLMSSESEQFQWDRDLKPQAKSARVAGLLVRSHSHYHSCRWPLLLDPSHQALIWLKPLPLEGMTTLDSSSGELRGKSREKHKEEEEEEEYYSEDSDFNLLGIIRRSRSEKREEVQEKKEEEEQETEPESPKSKPAPETQPLPTPYLKVLSGADPQLGAALCEAAANGQQVLLINMELGLECQELQWLLERERLSPPQVQPGFCLYLSTTLPLSALGKVLGCERLKGLNVLDLGSNLEILEEQMLHELMCTQYPEMEARWQEIKIRILESRKAVETAEEQLLQMMFLHNTKYQKPSKFLRHIVRAQARLIQLRADCEELEELRLQEMVLWAPYRHTIWQVLTIIKALNPLQNLLPPFRMSTERWLAIIKQALISSKKYEFLPGGDLSSHLLQLRIHLVRQLLGTTVGVVGLTRLPLVGALGALALLQATKKSPEPEMVALWPGLSASPSISYCKLGITRPAWLGLRAWQECGLLEVLPPFSGLCESLAHHPEVWQAYLSLSSTVLGPAPIPLSLLQKLILWRVLRPEFLVGTLADFTTSLLGRPLDENLKVDPIPFENSHATQPILILLPPPGHPEATLHPLTVIQSLAATHMKGHVEVIALGSEAWDPISVVVSTLHQAMKEGHWLVLENCHLMQHWPNELLRPLLELLDAVKDASDPDLQLLLAEPASRKVATVHQDFRLWLIMSADSLSSLPAVLTHHCMPVFWNQSLELHHVLIDSMVLAQQGRYVQPPARMLPLLLLHSLLSHRQLYGRKLQAHRGGWTQMTLTRLLQIQDQLWANLSNPYVALQELVALVFYGSRVEDEKDTEALLSLTQTFLDPKRGSGAPLHTPQHLLTALMFSSELRNPEALEQCKAQVHLLFSTPEPQICGVSSGTRAWLLRCQSRVLLRDLRWSSVPWVPASQAGSQRAERRLRQRLVQAQRRLELLQALLSTSPVREEANPVQRVPGSPLQPLDNFLETEVQELRQLVGHLLQDLHCLLQQLTEAHPCASPRCVAVAQALWKGQFPQPWRPHAPAGLQPPWHWLRQLSRQGQLLIRYMEGGSEVPVRTFHLSAFSHPRRLLLSLSSEALSPAATSKSHYVSNPGDSNLPNSTPKQQLLRHQSLNSNALHFQVVKDPNAPAPEKGVLLVGLQLQNAEWDPQAGALQHSTSCQPCPLPPVRVSPHNGNASDQAPKMGLPVYSCPVYLEGFLGVTNLHSRNILMHLPLPTKLCPATCAQWRVHVCSPPLL
ncbi:dynein heavy chain domain-containing protein 1 [Sorex fumeus]|uniref:dynein heavy chain domain-containing protein 1 n=1 Tax=Sorex fumeus TaxID=62283 RepID=UPI0024AE2E99|nr:dynein heavy chain domain-containing protein 1 [Sorex fumeus]